MLEPPFHPAALRLVRVMKSFKTVETIARRKVVTEKDDCLR